jgi:hypothetical protein
MRKQERRNARKKVKEREREERKTMRRKVSI